MPAKRNRYAGWWSLAAYDPGHGHVIRLHEFFFPLSALRCYLQYDCTGQQLLDSGYVLINGERVALNLQSAESAHLQKAF
jgi:hypothetical protein